MRGMMKILIDSPFSRSLPTRLSNLYIIWEIWNWIIIWMNYRLSERKSWDQIENHECYEIFEFDEIEYEDDKNQRMNQKCMNK